jgi:hypothetical protein
VRHRSAEDEAARLDAGDLVDLPSSVVMSRNTIPGLG